MDDRGWDSAIREFEYITSIDSASEEVYGSLGIAHLFSRANLMKQRSVSTEHSRLTLNTPLP